MAPRLGAIYRLTEDTVLRAGYGRTFNPLPWARPLRGSFPFDIFFNQTAEQYGAFPIQNGIPPVPIPDLSSGRVKLPPNTFMRSPNPDDVDRATIQQMNVAVEQRLPGDISLELAYVHTRTDGGYADLNVNHSEPGAGQTGRKFFAVAGTTAINDWASRTKSRYHGLQIAVNRPFRNGLLLKGAYTLSKSENETTTRTAGPASPGTIPSCERTSRWPASTAPTSSRWASSTSCPSPRVHELAGPDRPELAGQRHLRRVLGHAVLDHRARTPRSTARLRRRS